MTIEKEKGIKYDFKGRFDPRHLSPFSIDAQSMTLIEKGKRVLELGSATGFMSQYMTDTLNCTVIGVELNPKQADIGKRWCKDIVVGDIESEKTLQSIREQVRLLGGIDIILASSILEHLKEPGCVLKQVSDLLEANGYIVVSLPNIAHWTARKDLMLGRFEYQDYGIMDRTHLRFFTIDSGRRLIEGAGFRIVHFSVEPFDVPIIPVIKRVSIFGLLRRINPDIARVYMMRFCRFIGYQMLFRAIKG